MTKPEEIKMSKKKIYSKHLEKGKFYIHSDGHKGHPALLFSKIDKKNKYLILVFTSSPGPRRVKLKHSIEPEKISQSFVHKNPTIAKRGELGRKPLEGIKIHNDDKIIVKIIIKKATHRN